MLALLSAALALLALQPSRRLGPFPVLEVLDGDTLRVERAGEPETLRLLSVDTEEKIDGRVPSSPLKPATVFGEETAQWVRALLLGGDGPARVRLLLPGAAEERDAFGRLLCHVLLADGRDLNLLLVEEGRSPYYTKYGSSRIAHTALRAAEVRARRAGRGIWDPATNRPRTPGAPVAARPYELLLPWWRARAEALDAFRRRAARDPGLVAADDPEALGRAAASEEAVEVLGEPARFYEEEDGSLTVLLGSARDAPALRVVVAAEREPELERWLRRRTEPLVQNFVLVRGVVRPGPRGYRVEVAGADAWSLAGPEVARPPPGR